MLANYVARLDFQHRSLWRRLVRWLAHCVAERCELRRVIQQCAVDRARQAPPQAPVLEIKPRHMLAADGAVVRVPVGMPALQVSASLGIVIGAVACRVSAARALDHVAGYLLVGDISAPLPNHYRPGARFKARDGFCPLGAHVVPASAVADPDALAGRVLVDGVVVHEFTTGERVRGVAQLIADVTEFMTLQAGDVLALGISHGAPWVEAGHAVTLTIDSVGSLRLRVEAEAA